jgi:hypothetical protein
VADDGGRLITIDPETGTFTFVGSVSATGGNSLGALAAGSQAEPGAITDDLDGDGVVDELDNCPATPNADQADSNLNGTGDACEPQELSHESAAFLQANPDGTTGVEPTSLPLTEEPVIEERLVRIVQFRLNSGLSNSAPQLTTNLVDGLVDVGLVAPGDAANLVGDVLDDISLETPTPPLTQTGDANCNGLVNAVDAALILQFGAGLTASLPCRDAADVNGDGLVNAIDASLVLQFDAGLLDHLPP